MNTSMRDLERLGDEIAELSAHLEAATARLLAPFLAFGLLAMVSSRLPRVSSWS